MSTVDGVNGTLLKNLIPRAFAASVPSCDLGALKEAGIKGIVLDIDNTICPWGEACLAPGIPEWVARAKEEGFALCLVSNARRGRAEAVGQLLGIPVVHGAVKPRRAGFRRALALLGTAPAETAALGDQVFTDILGGNRAGLFTILVQPVARRELVATRVTRFFEARVLAWLAAKGIFPGWTSIRKSGRHE